MVAEAVCHPLYAFVEYCCDLLFRGVTLSLKANPLHKEPLQREGFEEARVLTH